MITDFFLDVWFGVIEWTLSLFGEFEGLPSEIEDAVAGVSSFFGQTGAFLGALNQWFPVTEFLAVVAVALVVEVGIAFVRGVRVVKQLLPFQ